MKSTEAGIGSASTTLVVLRGNSGSGKSTTARQVRERYGRGIAWVEQDYLRRILLRERDQPGGVNIGLIEQTVRFALDHGYHVLLDGILCADHYGSMLERLWREHRGETRFYRFRVSFEQTVRRHATRPQAADFTPEQMAEWYRPTDPLGFVDEHIIAEDVELAETVQLVLGDFVLGERSPQRQTK